MLRVDKQEFERHLSEHPLALPDGFKLVGSWAQTRWFEEGREIARKSQDKRGTLYEIATEA